MTRSRNSRTDDAPAIAHYATLTLRGSSDDGVRRFFVVPAAAPRQPGTSRSAMSAAREFVRAQGVADEDLAAIDVEMVT